VFSAFIDTYVINLNRHCEYAYNLCFKYLQTLFSNNKNNIDFNYNNYNIMLPKQAAS